MLISGSVISDSLQPYGLGPQHSPPGPSVHRISQTRILEWVVFSFCRRSSGPRDQTWIPCIGRQIFLSLSHQGSPTPLLVYPKRHSCGPKVYFKPLSDLAYVWFTSKGNTGFYPVSLVGRTEAYTNSVFGPLWIRQNVIALWTIP